MSDTSSPEAPPRKNKRWLLPALLLVLAVIGAGGYFAWKMIGVGHSAAPAPSPPPIFLALEPFTVNLQPGGAQRHLHVAVSLRLADTPSQALLIQYLPEVRSRVLGVLANREGAALMDAPARDALAEELGHALARPLAPQQAAPKVSGVLFTTFLLQ